MGEALFTRAWETPVTKQEEILTRPDHADVAEPVAWVHTIWHEFGQFQQQLTYSESSPFGIPGEDHSKCYPVTSEPLYRKTIINKPRVTVR